MSGRKNYNEYSYPVRLYDKKAYTSEIACLDTVLYPVGLRSGGLYRIVPTCTIRRWQGECEKNNNNYREWEEQRVLLRVLSSHRTIRTYSISAGTCTVVILTLDSVVSSVRVLYS